MELGEQVTSVADMICCPGNVEIPRALKKKRGALELDRHVKVNIDGSFWWSSSQGCIGGMLKDSGEGFLSNSVKRLVLIWQCMLNC